MAIVALAAAALACCYIARVLMTAWLLRPGELPGALLCWLLGGEHRRRLRRVIGHRREPSSPREVTEFEAGLARMAKARPVTASLVLRASQAAPYPEKQLVTTARPACDDPACCGCQALRARRRHDQGCGSNGTVCAGGRHVRTGNGWAGL